MDTDRQKDRQTQTVTDRHRQTNTDQTQKARQNEQHTNTARMALTFLWHGCYGGVSRLGPLLWRVLSDMVLEQHPLIFSASGLQSLPFEDGAHFRHRSLAHS